jgi:hypothetical protein
MLTGEVINRFASAHVVLSLLLPIGSTLLVLMYDIDRKSHQDNVQQLGYVDDANKTSQR